MSNSKGYNLGLNAEKLNGVLITTKQGNRALVIPIDDKTVVEKEGKAYINLTLWASDDADQYGNHLSAQKKMSKEERDAGEKAEYIGNGKQFYPSGGGTVTTTAQPTATYEADDDGDGLPF